MSEAPEKAVTAEAESAGLSGRSRSAGAPAAGQDLSDEEIDRIFHALADATRRDIVSRTLVGESSLSRLADAYDMSFAAVHKHVSVLESAGLVTKHKAGRERLVRANPERIRRARQLLDQYEFVWRSRMQQLEEILAIESS